MPRTLKEYRPPHGTFEYLSILRPMTDSAKLHERIIERYKPFPGVTVFLSVAGRSELLAWARTTLPETVAQRVEEFTHTKNPSALNTLTNEETRHVCEKLLSLGCKMGV